MYSIIIPLYNSAKRIGPILKYFENIDEELPNHFDFILVDDGSKDGTKKKLIELHKSTLNLNIKLILLKTNIGQSKAILTGINKSDGEIILLMDDDIILKTEDIKIALKKIEKGEYDLINFSRIGRIFPSKIYKIGHNLANNYLNWVSGRKTKIKDATSPIKIFKKNLLPGINNIWKMDYFIQEYAFVSAKNIGEINIQYFSGERSKSRYSRFKVLRLFSTLFFVFLFAKFFKRISQKKPDKNLDNYYSFIDQIYVQRKS